MAGNCLIYDRECVDCGECDMCDLIEGKICDDCGKCIDGDGNYRSLDVIKYYNDLEKKHQH